MAKRMGGSFADMMNSLQQLIAGLKASDNPQQQAYAESLSAGYERLRILDQKQEQAKADLHTATAAINAETAQTLIEFAKTVSFLESQYGKKGTQLQSYGLATRKHGGGRGSKKNSTESGSK